MIGIDEGDQGIHSCCILEEGLELTTLFRAEEVDFENTEASLFDM